MKISVNKYTLEPEVADGGTAGSRGTEQMEFSFSPEWNELCRTVTFFPPKAVAKCVSFTGDTVPLPPEVTARAGKVAYVLCGARDGVTIITLSGVIEVAETLLPTESETEEYTPGALAMATMLCEEARVDAQTAAAAAQSAEIASSSVSQMAEEVQSARNVVSDLYDDVMDGVAVHESITEDNCSDRTHAPSVAGVVERQSDLMSLLCPLRVKMVDQLPGDPGTDTIYLKDGKGMIYFQVESKMTMYVWTPTFTSGGGPAQLYSYEGQISVGSVLYWCGVVTPSTVEDMIYFDTVTAEADGAFETSYGTFTVESNGEVSLSEGSLEAGWVELTEEHDLTPYLQENAGKWLLAGGVA